MGTTNDRWLTGDAYEAYMGRWSRPLAREFLRWFGAGPGAHWLEMGCGTGALTTAICELAGPASVTACDPAAPFVEHARQQEPGATFVVADASNLPSREGGFDYIVSGLVLNFVPDPGAAVAAMRERLEDAGSVAAYVWDYSDGMEFLRHFWDEVIAGDRDAAPLDEGRRFPLCSPSALTALFGSAGLERVTTHGLEIPTRFATFGDFWAPLLRGTGPAPSYVAGLDPARRDALKARLERRLKADPDGTIRLKARAWAVRGERV